jgi:hypothetical protein
MESTRRITRGAWICAAALLLGACAGQKEPAQKLIDSIDATVAAASNEAAKYVPDQLADVQSRLEALKASFGKQDFAAVVAQAPAVLGSAQGLATAAAAKKDALLKALNDEWTELAASVPGEVAAIQSRIDLLGKKSSKKMAAGIDLDAAKSGLAEAAGLWSKAQGAFASGNLDEAVSTAKDVQTKAAALAGSLKLDPPAAAVKP